MAVTSYNREVGKYLTSVGPDAKPGQLVRAQVLVAAAFDEYLARLGPDEAAQDVEQRGLACPVRPDDAHDVPGRHGERHGIERGQPAEPDSHAPHL